MFDCKYLMTKKQKLILLLSQTKGIENQANKILKNIDDYLPETIEKMIVILEKTKERKKRINNGEANKVIQEIRSEKSQKKQSEIKMLVKNMRSKEEKDKVNDDIQAEAMINELENIKTF